MRKLVRKTNVAQLPPGYAVDTHFNPAYDPWDQRMCLVPDGDLFRAIKDGSASVVTDRIAHLHRDRHRAGVGRAARGRRRGDRDRASTCRSSAAPSSVVDGEPVKPHETMAYRAMMLSGVPNFAFTIGYTNASWTLKADLVGEYVVRLLKRLRSTGAALGRAGARRRRSARCR